MLDGGEIPNEDTVAEEHNHGLIAYYMKGLLDRGAQPDPANHHNVIAIPNVRMGQYPIIFRGNS